MDSSAGSFAPASPLPGDQRDEFLQAVQAIQRTFGEAERARLRRIYARAQADCEAPALTFGTGAQSTRKRALAVLMALEGASLEQIAPAAALSPHRVFQALTHAAAQGFAALYPTFAENLDGPDDPGTNDLWAVLQPILVEPPSKQGSRIERWTPLSALDCLIHLGKIEDSSAGRIEQVIKQFAYQPNGDQWVTYAEKSEEKKKKHLKMKIEIGGIETEIGGDEQEAIPLRFEIAEKPVSQVREGSLGWYALMLVFLAFGIVLLFEAHASMADSEGLAALLEYIFGGLFTLLTVFMFYRVLEEAKLARAMFGPGWRKNTIPKKADGALLPTVRASAAQIIVHHAEALPPMPWNIAAISDTANAAGMKPIPIMYLWVFQAHSKEQWVYETHGWLQTGPVNLLMSPSSLSLSALRHAKDHLVRGNADLEKMMAQYTAAAGDYPRPLLFFNGPGIGKQKPYRGYPIHTPVCTNAMWQAVFQHLTEKSELAVFNLSGFSPEHPGIEFELKHVMSSELPRHWVFMYDRLTDADAAMDGVLRLWEGLDHKGRNRRLIFLRYAEPQIVGYGNQFHGKRSRLGTAFSETFLEDEGAYRPVAGSVIQLVQAIDEEMN
jgi:hypothetical protein